MRQIILVLFILISIQLKAQTTYFPPLAGNSWDTISMTTLGWCPEKADDLLNYLEIKNTKAFIVLKDGKIVIEKYFGKFTQDSVWYWASAGKTLTGFMVGIAQQEGFLSINDKTSKYLGEGWTNTTKDQEDKITIRHQLMMTSGLNDAGDPYCTMPLCLTYKADAGTRWAYHNGPYTLLDKVIEEATGTTLSVYTNQKLKQQAGITGTFVKVDYNNVFFSKPRSMARFGLLMLNEGTWDGKKILKDTAYFNQMINSSQNHNKSYGYLTWLNGKSSFMMPSTQKVFPGSINYSAPDDMYAAMGKNGQIINIVPSQNLLYIRMGEAPGVGDVPITFNDTIWQKLNALMCNINSVNILKDKTNLEVYPNPASDYIKISLPGKYFKVITFDSLGKMVYEKDNCLSEFDMKTTQLTPGIYYVKTITSNNRSYSRKLLICR